VPATTVVEELGENKYGFSMRVSVPAMADVCSAIVVKLAAAAITAAANFRRAYDL
jgi:hypothetical protein